MPLRQFIEHLYEKRFGRKRPEVAMSIEARWSLIWEKKEARRAAKQKLAMETA